MANLDNIINKLDDEIMNANEELETNSYDLSEFDRRIRILGSRITNLTQLLEREENPEVINELSQRLNDLNNQLNEYNGVLINIEEDINKTKNKIKNLKSTKAFSKMTTLPSFQSRNNPKVADALNMPEIIGNIAEYGGSKRRIRSNKRMSRKMNMSRRINRRRNRRKSIGK